MRIFRNTVLLAAGGMLAWAAPMLAQGAGSQASTQPSKSAASANQRAADLLNTINKNEVDEAKMMADHTQNSSVKDFAQMLQNDHQDAQNKLESAAQQSNISLKTNKAEQQQGQAETAALQKLSGASADSSFARDEVRDHRRAIRQLQRLQPQITDPQIKSVVQDTIPVLQKHLDAAEKLQSQLGKPGGGSH